MGLDGKIMKKFIITYYCQYFLAFYLLLRKINLSKSNYFRGEALQIVGLILLVETIIVCGWFGYLINRFMPGYSSVFIVIIFIGTINIAMYIYFVFSKNKFNLLWKTMHNNNASIILRLSILILLFISVIPAM
jgi:hypothetical protein